MNTNKLNSVPWHGTDREHQRRLAIRAERDGLLLTD